MAVILELRYKLDIIEFRMSKIHSAEQIDRFIISLKLDIEDLYSHYNNSG